MKIKPNRLKKGDCIGLVSPASPLEESKFACAIENIERLGFRVKYTPNLNLSRGFLAGNDEIRLNDIHNLFADKEVQGIMCLRGGYGSGRLLHSIDYNLIGNHPKVFVGYSDITAMLNSFLTKAGLVCFHGPVAASDFTTFTSASLLNQITGSTANESIPLNEEVGSVFTKEAGKITGEIIGGNLSILSSLMGTPFEPDFKNKMVIIEEVGEPPYRIDRMITQLINAGKLQHAAAVAFGVFEDCERPKHATDGPDVPKVLAERFSKLDVPVLYGLQFGHTPDNATIPFGINAELDFGTGTLRYLEEAVS